MKERDRDEGEKDRERERTRDYLERSMEREGEEEKEGEREGPKAWWANLQQPIILSAACLASLSRSTWWISVSGEADGLCGG